MKTYIRISATLLIAFCVSCAVYLVHSTSTPKPETGTSGFRTHATAPFSEPAGIARATENKITAAEAGSHSNPQVSTANQPGAGHPIQLGHPVIARNRSTLKSESSQTSSTFATLSAPRPVTHQRETSRSHLPETQHVSSGTPLSHPQVQWSFADGPSGRELIVPTGASLPASLIDAGEDATQAQVDAMDEIAADFIEDLASNTEAGKDSTPKIQKPKSASRVAAWDAATRAANERYRMLFGVEAYNARTAAAAKDALAEIKAQASLDH